jgi:hypothetical protein
VYQEEETRQREGDKNNTHIPEERKEARKSGVYHKKKTLIIS